MLYATFKTVKYSTDGEKQCPLDIAKSCHAEEVGCHVSTKELPRGGTKMRVRDAHAADAIYKMGACPDQRVCNTAQPFKQQASIQIVDTWMLTGAWH